MQKKHLFLSYCHENQAEVARLRDDLIAADEMVWWDADIQPGQDWKQAIRRAMRESYAVVLCLSSELTERIQSGVYPEVLNAITEYRLQTPGNIFLIPIRFSPCEVPDIEIDDTRQLSRLQYVDLFPSSQYENGLKLLIQSLRAAPGHTTITQIAQRNKANLGSYVQNNLSGPVADGGFDDRPQNANPHIVTIVFTDIVDSTAINQNRSGSTVTERNKIYQAEIWEPHSRFVKSRLDDFGGRIVKEIGDSFLLEFEDAAQAAFWAISVQHMHKRQPIETSAIAAVSQPLQIKMAMHIGSPLPVGSDLMGQEINYTQRLLELANGGQIVISHAVQSFLTAAVGEGIQTYFHGRLRLKGIGTVTVFELLYDDKSPQALKESILAPVKLPQKRSGFVGHSDLRVELRRRINDREPVVLKGVFGIGKTALAIQIVHEALKEQPGGAIWINCEAKPGLETCLRTMAHVLFSGLMDKEQPDIWKERVTKHLRENSGLVVFDSFEELINDKEHPEKLREILSWMDTLRGEARIIVTTRDALPTYRMIEVPELTPAEAIELFTKLAHIDELGVKERALISELCHAVGYLPLAIELLAAQAMYALLPRLCRLAQRGLKLLEILKSAEQRAFPNVTSEQIIIDHTSSDEPQRKTVQACFTLSFARLSISSRKLLRQLSVLPDGAGDDVITAIMRTENWDSAAGDLVAKSFWRKARDRYTVHPLVRQMALEKLKDKRAEAEYHATHAVINLAYAKGELTAPGAAGPEERIAALDWLEGEWRNILVCADIAFRYKEWKLLGLLSEAVRDFSFVRGYWEDCESIHDRALLAQKLAEDEIGYGMTLGNLGLLRERQGRFAEAEQIYKECLTIKRQWQDLGGQGRILSRLGNVCAHMERWGEAKDYCGNSWKIATEVNDNATCGIALNTLGFICERLGDHEAAEDCCMMSLEVFQNRINDEIGKGNTLRNLSIVLRRRGKYTEAIEFSHEGIEIARRVNDRHNEGRLLDNLGKIFMAQQKWDMAASHFQSALAVKEDIEDRLGQVKTLRNLALAHESQGDIRGALRLVEQALEVLNSTRHQEVLRTEIYELIGRWQGYLG